MSDERGTDPKGWTFHDGTKYEGFFSALASDWAEGEPNIDEQNLEQDCVGILSALENDFLENWYCWNNLNVVCQSSGFLFESFF